jgi:hypothetical protein
MLLREETKRRGFWSKTGEDVHSEGYGDGVGSSC